MTASIRPQITSERFRLATIPLSHYGLIVFRFSIATLSIPLQNFRGSLLTSRLNGQAEPGAAAENAFNDNLMAPVVPYPVSFIWARRQ